MIDLKALDIDTIDFHPHISTDTRIYLTAFPLSPTENYIIISFKKEVRNTKYRTGIFQFEGEQHIENNMM